MNFEELKAKLIQEIWRMNSHAANGDNNRNRVCYGSIIAYGVMLRCMGHDTEIDNCWENEKGCLTLSHATIDGEELPI